MTARLCRLDDIADGGSAGFSAEIDGRQRALLAVRAGGAVHVYINACPHRGLPLDLKPGEFLTHDREYILCRNHAAQFRMEDGHCVAGPCVGAGLMPVDVRIEGGEIFVGGKS